MEQSLNHPHLSFSMPELTGTDLCIGNDMYTLYAKNERLTDTFLDTLINCYVTNSYDLDYTLYTDLNYKNAVIFHFSKEFLSIESKENTKTYQIAFNYFCETFFDNIKKYAIYWAAPANYRAWFFAPFDDFVKKAERYREKGNDIINKLPLPTHNL